MTAPILSIQIEPLESGDAVYLPLAPKTSDHQPMIKLVLRLHINNGESGSVHVEAIRFSFPGSAVPAIDMKAVSLDIGAGAGALWSNGAVKLSDGSTISNAVYLPAPGPSQFAVSVSCSGFSDPVISTLDLSPCGNATPQGAYLFPFSASDLRVGEYFVTSAQHWANGGGGGGQIFAHDIGVHGMDPATQAWSDRRPGTSGTKNEDFRIWGKPVRAMADGAVESWHNGMESNTVIGNFPNPAPNPLAGNHIWVRHGNELVLYAHFQKDTIPAELMQSGAPVKAGQRLGLAGNSGNATNPHTHIQCVRDSTSGPLRPMPFRSAWVIDRQAFDPPNPAGPWAELAGRGIPKDPVAIWPAASAPAWYPPGWGEVAHHGIPEAQYQTLFNRVTSSGYRPVWLDGYEIGGAVFFNAIFRPADGTAWTARHGLTGSAYKDEFDKQTANEMRLINLTSYVWSGSIRYAAIFAKIAGPAWRAYHGLTATQHQTRFNELAAEGFRPVNASVVSLSGDRSYAAFYTKADVGSFLLKSFLTPDEYQTQWNENTQAGRRLAYLSAYQHAGGVRFSAIFQEKAPGSGGTIGRHHLTAQQMQTEYDTRLGQGLLTRVITGYEFGGQHRFAGAWRRA